MIENPSTSESKGKESADQPTSATRTPVVNFDGRALQPNTRHWGPGVVVTNILSRLQGRFDCRGIGHRFEDAEDLGFKTWPSLGRLNKLAFEFSPLLLDGGDLYWGTNSWLPQFGMKFPSVLTVYDLLLLYYPEDQRGATWLSRRFISSLRRADRIIVISSTTADELAMEFPFTARKTEVALLGYDSSQSQKATSTQSSSESALPLGLEPYTYCIMLGAHRPRKNLPVAIEAVKSARQAGLPLKLVVTGDIHSSYSAIANSARDFLIATGPLPRHLLQSLIRHAHALLYPSRYEGFGLPLLEAMAAGCPVLASDIAIHKEVAGQAAILLPFEIPRWTEAIHLLLHDRSRRDELISRGQENLRRFSWDRTADIYAGVFTDLL